MLTREVLNHLQLVYISLRAEASGLVLIYGAEVFCSVPCILFFPVATCTVSLSTSMAWIFQQEPECSVGCCIPGHAVRPTAIHVVGCIHGRTGKLSQLRHFRRSLYVYRAYTCTSFQSLYMFQMELKKPPMYNTVLIELSPCTVCGLISTPAAFWQLKHAWKLQWMARMDFSLIIELATLEVIPCQTHYM